MVKAERLPSGSYRIKVLDYKDKDGKAHYRSFTGKNKKAVQLEAAQFEASRKDNRQGKITVYEAMERCVESKKNVLSPRTYREYTQTRKIAFQSLHNINIFDLTQEDVQAAVNAEAEIHAPKTVHNKYGVFLTAFKMFRPDYTLRTVLPQKEKPDIIIPTEEEVMKLIQAVHDTEIELPVLLAALAGMRSSEIVGLKWKNIDFKAGTIKVDTAIVRNIENKFVEKGTKSYSGFRIIKMVPYLKSEMKRLYNPDDTFITTLKAHQIYKRYQKVLEKVCPETHYTLHELRHYTASVMIMLGIPVKYIADMLGHKAEDMVQKVYGHIMRDKTDMFFERLEAYYSDAFKRFSDKSATKSAT